MNEYAAEPGDPVETKEDPAVDTVPAAEELPALEARVDAAPAPTVPTAPTPNDAPVLLTAPPYPAYVITSDRTYYPVRDGRITVHPRHAPELVRRADGADHRRVS